MVSTNTIITVLGNELCVNKKEEVTEKGHCSNKIRIED